MKRADLPAGIQDIILEAAANGGQVIRDAFPTAPGRTATASRNKGSQSYNLVTATDEESEAVIIDTIRRAFPGHAILAEEGHSEVIEADHLWIIDPLDGTNNFAHGIPHCAVSIGYCQHGQMRLGVVHNPLTGDWFRAVAGEGARHNDQPIRVSDATELDSVLVGVGFYYDRGEMMQSTLRAIAELFQHHIHGIRRFGTASLDLCHVATGRFGAFFEYALAPWDFAAGSLIVTEAGGVMSDARGRPLSIRGSSVLATTPALRASVLEIVSRHCPPRS